MDTPVSDDKSPVTAEPEVAAIAAAAEPVQPEPAAEPVAIPAPTAEPVAAPQAEGAAAFAVGPTLRAAREKKGKSLPECSKEIRIRQPFLEALEDGRHRDLPGGTYAAGFLRTYAEFLALDGEEMVRRFRQEGAGGFTARAELSFPSPVTEGRIPGGAVIFLGIILAGLAYGGWYFMAAQRSKVAEMVPPLPDRLSSMLSRQAALTGESRDAAKSAEDQTKVKEDVVPPQEAEDDKPSPAAPQILSPQAPAPAELASVAPEPPKAEPPKVEVPKVEPAKPEPPKVEAPKVEPAKTEPPKVEPAKPESAKVEPPKVEAEAPATGVDGKVFGTEYADSRVVLKATGDDCWIQVREMDGSLLMSRLLRRGDSFRVPNRPGLNLMVGNAGSLEVSVDGKKAPSLGAAGQVRRDIRLDPDKLTSGG